MSTLVTSRAAVVVAVLAGALWLMRPLHSEDGQPETHSPTQVSASDAAGVVAEREGLHGAAATEADAPKAASGASIDVKAAEVVTPSNDALREAGPLAAAADTAKTVGPAVITFSDSRPLTEPAAGDETAAATQPGAASFVDTRPLPGTEVKDENAGSSKNTGGTASQSQVAAQFWDERPLATASFNDDRLVAPTSFRDDRPVSAPSFVDERAVTQPSFSDQRPVGEPAFSDTRSLVIPDASDTGTNPVKLNAGPADQPVVTDPESAAEVPSHQPAGETSAPTQGSLPTLVAVSPSAAITLDANSGCKAPEVTSEPLDGGQMRLRIAAGCHPGEAVQVSYGGAEFIRKLNSWGALDFILDCFAGSSSSAEVRFADGTRKTLTVAAKDFDKVSKIAVVWRAAANLDLHVFEYGARDTEIGHVWAKSPSSMGAARVQSLSDKRGHGLMGMSDDGETLGDKVEVYTFVHNDEQESGAISMALDYESRGEKPEGATCGAGALAEVDFQVNILPRNGQVSRQTGVLTRVECGALIPREARFNQSALPVLRIKK